MSLVGIRSLSLLETPPLNRYSVQTYVVEKDKNLIRDAIQKELSRNGQVFYLHNNIFWILVGALIYPDYQFSDESDEELGEHSLKKRMVKC